VSWYFCDEGNPKLKVKGLGLEIIIRALASRLALLPDRTLAKAAKTSYTVAESSHSQEKDYTIEDWEKLFEDLVKDSPTQSQIVIVVDALDECDSVEAEHFLIFMMKIVKDHPNVRFLCSSHQQVRVREISKRILQTDYVPDVEMTEAATAESMKIFITEELEAMRAECSDSIFCA